MTPGAGLASVPEIADLSGTNTLGGGDPAWDIRYKIEDQGVYLNDLEGLILHELGHALGLGHSDVIQGVMCGYIFPGDVWDGSQCDYTHVNHKLHPDDVTGMRVIYGLPAVPISPVAGAVLGILLAAVGARAANRRAP